MSVDAQAVLEKWHGQGFSGGVWVDPPGQTWEGYVHDDDELFMVVEGDVELELAGKAFRPAVGEEVLIPARVRHSVRNRGASIARWLYAYGGEEEE